MDVMSSNNGKANVVYHTPPHATVVVAEPTAGELSDESTNSRDTMQKSTICKKECNGNGRNRPEDKPASFSNIVDRRVKKLIPLFFERSSGNILNPIFDSDILESEFQRFSVNVDKIRFHIALVYISIACIALAAFFGATHVGTTSHYILTAGNAVLGTVALIIFVVTKFVKLYTKPNEARILSITVSMLIAVVEVVTFFVIDQEEFSFGARFGLATCIIIVIYTMMPALPLYACLIIAVVFSIAHELSACFTAVPKRKPAEIVCIVLLHICIHILGISIIFMAQLRRRSTFWRVGQSVVAKQDLNIEQRIKNRMIRSVMPEKVADFLIKNGLKQKRVGPKAKTKRVAFRPFHMYHMEDVSILFADIVGFTKMSAKKEANELVHLLNLLFGKFDELTEINDCEKISTLGDCYYCVAGCPEKSAHHALSCIEMGLDITVEIKRHDIEDVDMRVGIHTGNVLCGIVGDRRLRFDVWSNDVVLANKMESKGKPGRVHITETTYSFVKDLDIYDVEEGCGYERPEANGGFLKSYFIKERKNGLDAHKPWQKAKESAKQVAASLDDADMASISDISISDGMSFGVKSGKSIETEVAFNLCKNAKYGSNSETSSIEQNFLSKSISPTISPTTSKIQKHLVKTPLPYPRICPKFNYSYGMTLNEALMRDAMRASNDNQLVKLMHEKKIQKEYFFNPPLHLISLNFIDEAEKPIRTGDKEEDEWNEVSREKNREPTEARYRDEGFKGFKLNPNVVTFASPKIHLLFDVLVNSITLTVLVIALVLKMYSPKFPTSLMVVIPLSLLTIFGLLLYQFVRVSPSTFPKKIHKCTNLEDKDISDSGIDEPGSIKLHDMRNHNIKVVANESNWQACQRRFFTPWVMMHIYGGLIACLPITVVMATYEDCTTRSKPWESIDVEFFSMFAFVCFSHFCSFTQLSWLMKAMINTLWFIVIIVVLLSGKGSSCINLKSNMLIDDSVMCIALQFLLVAVLNHIHEKGVRANFYGDKEAAEQKNIAMEQKQVADLLIHDMFPSHVHDQLRYNMSHSRNYEVVGVLFASITNFYEFYEENYEGGIECIRVLHELVADFDKLLDVYEDIEKIKTVSGTTFMAASGLNVKIKYPMTDDQPHQYLHLKRLMDFALDLKRTLEEFNTNMLGFGFHLRCGFNAGPVTAGVIGTMKPQYDIWGDTVNLASRMDSTGVPDKIQVAEQCMEKLTDFFTFEKRGTIPVKGKGDVSTYLLVNTIENSIMGESRNAR